jgi:ribose transport system substrate-binding protein
MITRKDFLAVCFSCLLTLNGFAAQPDDKELAIGVVGRSDISEYRAVRAGAADAARDLSKNGNVQVKVEWREPAGDPASQAAAIEELRKAGARALIVSAYDRAILDQIHMLKSNGVPAAVYDGDREIPESLATLGTDNIKCGALLLDRLAREIGDKGLIAIFGGINGIPVFMQRVQGVQMQAKLHPEIRSAGVCYSEPKAEQVFAQMMNIRQAHPDLNGWAMVVDWVDFGQSAAVDPPGKVKYAVVDPGVEAALRSIKERYVQVLLVKGYYEWGHTSVDLLFDKIVNDKDPPSKFLTADLTPVTRENIEDFTTRWNAWMGKKE